MSYLLHIETATTNCSVALSHNGNLLHCIENNAIDFRHSDYLHLFIEELLSEVQINYSQLDGVVVSMGPGSYTGLRIGMSTAKGLCYAQDIPLLAINSLRILAEAYEPKNNQILIPLFDARRMEVYSLILNAQKQIIRDTDAEVISENSFQEYKAQGQLVFFGSGAAKCKELLQEEDNTLFIDDLEVPSARNMIKIGQAKFVAKEFQDIAYFDSFYLKKFYTNAPSKP